MHTSPDGWLLDDGQSASSMPVSEWPRHMGMRIICPSCGVEPFDPFRHKAWHESLVMGK